MTKASKLALMYAAMGIMGSSMYGRKDQDVFGDSTDQTAPLPVQKIPPSGTKEYFFNEDGEFSTDYMRKTECVFTCFAVNDRNAMRKFYNWNINR